jgi:beta-glucosidase
VTLNKKDFGKNFHWGVSTAAYQIEGAHNKDGKGLSIWDIFTQNPKVIKDGSDARKSCNHYKYFKKDIKLIQKLHIPNYRFSISWSRIIPYGIGSINHKGIDFYDRLIDRCLQKGITPWITLYHWDLPNILELKGGWTNRDILEWFGDYTKIVARKYGDRVKNWLVLNEPLTFVGAGYFLGYHAPGRRGMGNFIPAMHHAMLCQGIGGRILRNLVYQGNIGTTVSATQIDQADDAPLAVETAARFDLIFNRLFIEPLLGLGYPLKEFPLLEKVLRHMQPGDEKNLVFDFDFIGLQNYTREVVKYAAFVPYMKGRIIPADQRGVKKTAMGWEVYPPAIYNMLHKFNNYGKIKEFIITENGASYNDVREKKMVHDTERIDFIKSQLKQILKAKQDGVNVTGYFIWSLLDNFEWAEGYTQRFGLVYTNFKNRKRYIKDSGYWFAEFLSD